MKKDKVYELKIDEEDDLSGIDSISLVDEPAIEVNWIAFKKDKQQDFHIPDGEDEKYLQMLIEKGKPEEDLIKEGYKVYSIEFDGKEDFVSTDPNAESDWDQTDFLIRYKYILSPRISGQSSVIPTTRSFCKDLINKNYVWRIEDMDATTNDFGESALVWRGGYNCRHNWAKIRYVKDTKIVNKASVNKGKETIGGFPTDLTPDTSIMGYEQPLTVTERVIKAVQEGRAKPSTIKNLGLSKEKFNGVDVFGYKTKYFHMCPGATSLFEHLISMPDLQEDVIGMMRSAAVVADSVFKIEEEVIKSENGTLEQLEEAIVLVDDFKDIMSEIDKLVGMSHDVSFMDGHIIKISEYVPEIDLGYDVTGITGYVDPGIKKKKKKDEFIECKKCGHSWDMKDGGDKPYMCNKCGYNNKSEDFASFKDYPQGVKDAAQRVLDYVEENGWGSCGTAVGKQRANQLAKGEPISLETTMRMYSYLSRHKKDLVSSKSYDDGCGKLMYDSWGGEMALRWAERKIAQVQANAMSKQRFQTDEEKRIVVGPAMIPDLRIFRKDKNGDPYYVYFTKETIKMIAEKYMKNKYIDNNDKNHDGKAVKDVYVIESWIKEDEEDKSNKYGYEDLPIGTWFVSMKVKNDNIWNMVKKGELKGFSVSGYFEEIEKFNREEQFLKMVADILKNIKD